MRCRSGAFSLQRAQRRVTLQAGNRLQDNPVGAVANGVHCQAEAILHRLISDLE